MEIAAVFLPLAGFLIAGLLGPLIGDRGAMAASVAAMAGAAVVSCWLFVDVALSGNERTIDLFVWIASGSFQVDWAIRLDTLSAVMIATVNVVSALIHVYSIGYMAHDHSRPRFFAYLSLFTFFMLMLVTADNLVQMFFGWEGVGLASYLLIGFWYTRPSANAAAVKAFIVNRIGDFGFALGIFALFFLTGSVEFDAIFASAPQLAGTDFEFLDMQLPTLTVVCLLLFMGAMGKSAQLGLHTWLPDAMEGPTPVSALIHAATMVTAGVFMLARLSPVYEYAPDALTVVAIIGALTAFMAATIGLTQTDIKRVIAYSTMSQLGYMFFAVGVSAYSAAIFHLVTHAFFKALLFLGAGSVIHAMSDEQDMRRMGGLARLIPWTYSVMWIGSLALAGIGLYGVFGFAGYYSKDIILEAAFEGDAVGRFAFWLGIAAAFMTAFYSWRLLYLTFHGRPRADERVMAHVHESPWVMRGPLLALAVGSVIAGFALYDLFVGEARFAFWRDSIFVLPARDTVEAAHHAPLWVRLLPLVMALLGILLATWFYLLQTGLSAAVARVLRPLYVLSYRKWFFDELYDWLFVRPAFFIGRGLWRSGDLAVIDGVGPDGLAAASRALGRRFAQLQTGYVYHYAFAMLIGVVALVTWYLYAAAG